MLKVSFHKNDLDKIAIYQDKIVARYKDDYANRYQKFHKGL